MLGAEERIGVLERELFSQVRNSVAGEGAGFARSPGSWENWTPIRALAEVAVKNDYVRPELNDGDEIYSSKDVIPSSNSRAGPSFPMICTSTRAPISSSF